MVIVNTENIIEAATSGTDVCKIYSYGNLVWEKEPPMPVGNYIIFNALEPSTISLTNDDNAPNLEISFDGEEWTTWDYSTVSLTTGSILYMRGMNVDGFNSSGHISSFTMTGKVKCYGNIMKLIDYTRNLTTIPNQFCFYGLFEGCKSLVKAPQLPATTLKSYCYIRMFFGCSSLKTAPALPATYVQHDCYTAMFKNCTSLKSTPTMPYFYAGFYSCTQMFAGCSNLISAKGMKGYAYGEYCFMGMFMDCVNLIIPPELPATDLTDLTSCYNEMFKGCTLLTIAPTLPATKLYYNCYFGMFKDCSSLCYVKCLAESVISGCTDDWLSGVASTGTFVKKSGVNWQTGASGIPTGWTVEEI